MYMIFMGFLICVIMGVGLGVLTQRVIVGVASGISLFLLTIVFSSFTIISAGHTGVQVTLGEVNPVPLTEGVHFVNPISAVKDVDVRLQKDQLTGANAGTKDLQQVHTDIVVQYRLNASKVPQIYKEFGLNVDEKVLGPAINEAFKSVTAHYTSEELVTKRQQVSEEIQDKLKSKVAPFDIDVSGISLVNFGFSPEYQKAIEAKVIATQQTAKACLLYTSPSPRDRTRSRMPSSA